MGVKGKVALNLNTIFLFSVGIVFPILTWLLMPRIMEDRFRNLLRYFMLAILVVIILDSLLIFTSQYTIYKTLITSIFESLYRIVIYAGFITFFIQLILYMWWYTTADQDTVFQCWLWLEYLALAMTFWYILPPILYFAGFGINILEIVCTPILPTVVYLLLRDWPPLQNVGIIDKIFGNKYVRVFAFIFGIINSATVWYYIIIGEAPRTLFSICLASAIGALGWQTGQYKK
ncbi:MAG: hypothetical protein B6U95_08160 [Thermofilum sp. ex4484_82]|nr:MAG: hypothetical protein B6U95_08160 [Thermofilum sp. ex4484_82]OYT36591.1 MAG: hypothetical protein B6U96_08160 [Archaeoglobales archaeon ex4484_92]